VLHESGKRPRIVQFDGPKPRLVRLRRTLSPALEFAREQGGVLRQAGIFSPGELGHPVARAYPPVPLS
jgi:hypothetical protein